MGRTQSSGSRKSIFDPIHGPITVSGASLELVGHPAFQRLWGIRQTGFAHLVFPGANHTRLEHSLGVYWVAKLMADALGLSRTEAESVIIGGLLHDIGHGPLSHTLEPSMREVLGHGHERVSQEWILGLRSAPDSEGAPRSIPEILEAHSIAPREVANLIDPPPISCRPSLLHAMLHGAIDCDRIDYLQRDAHYTGVAHGAIDAVRLLATVRKFHGRLAFHEKGRSALEGFLVGRALMYSSVYYHKTVRAAEVMMQSAVERLPGYPWIARSLLELTDGELLCGLAHREDRSSRLIHGLLERRLFKRIWGASKLSPAKRARWARVSKNPPIRRGVEDELAEAVGLPPGGLLLDLAGIDTRDPGGRDWAQVLVVEDGAAVRPFRANSLWRSLVLRPPTLTPLAVYVDPKFRNLPQEKISRAVDRLS